MLGKAGGDGGSVMSLDGVSQNNTHLSGSAPHLTKIDAFVRRSAANDTPSRAGRYRVVQLPELSATPRRYPRYVPAANVSQALLDGVLIGGAQIAVLSLIYSRLALGGFASDFNEGSAANLDS